MKIKAIQNLLFDFLINLLVITSLFGCLSINTKEVYRTPEATADLKSRLGNIGVVSAQFIPRTELEYRVTATKPFLDKGRLPGGPILPQGFQRAHSNEALVAGILLSPVGNPPKNGGEENDLLGTDPEKDLNERENILKKSLEEMKIQENAADSFLKSARVRISFPFELIKGAGPSFEGETPDYRSLKENGIDTIQEMTVKQFGWLADGPIQPNLSLYMSLQVRLVSALENKELFIKSYHYESEKMKFSEWTDPDATVFVRELQSCYQALAEKMIKDIYLFDSFIQ